MEHTVALTRTESSEIILTGDLNAMGALFGGRLVSILDKVAAIAAMKHTRGPVVTLSIDQLVFKRPVSNGALLTVRSSVNRVFKTSMEVGAIAMSQNLDQNEPEHVCSAYFTFVALNRQGQKIEIPQVVPETENEKRRHDQAGQRREARLHLQVRLQGHNPSASAPKP